LDILIKVFVILIALSIIIFVLYHMSREYFAAHFDNHVDRDAPYVFEESKRAIERGFAYNKGLRIPHTRTSGLACHKTKTGYKHTHQTKKCGLGLHH